MKKMLSLFITIVFVLMGLSGCTGNDSGKEVTLRWEVGWSEQKDHKMVEEEANKLLAELLPNTKLKFNCGADLTSKWSMWMSAGEKIDLAWTGYTFDVAGEIRKGSYLELNDLIKEYAPNLQTEWEQYSDMYDSISVNDALYGIPHVQYYCSETSYLGIPEDLAEYMDKEAFLNAAHSEPITTEAVYQEMDKYFKKVIESGKADSDTIAPYVDIQNVFKVLATRGYDFIGTEEGGAMICYPAFEENPKIVDFHTTDAFKTFIKYASKWYKEGYISKNVLLGGGYGNRKPIATAHTSETWDKTDEDIGVKIHQGSDGENNSIRLLMDTREEQYVGTPTIGSASTYTVIPFTSENPERAIQLLDLLHSEKGKKLFNTLIYGIEGRHYEIIGENRIKPNGYIEQGGSNVLYGVANWRVGNLMFAYETPNVQEGQSKYVKNYLNEVKKTLYHTVFSDLHFDTEGVSNEILQVTNVNSEFENTLICGVLEDYSNTYNLMISKAEAAGIEKLISHYQSQADEHLASK